MNLKLKKTLKNITPPFLLDLLMSFSGYGWFGNYPSWELASSKCVGYDSDIIVEKCKNAALKVKNKEALFERDSVLFYEKEYSNVMLFGLLHSIAENNKNINVVDFGGSFGSSYFQNLLFLSSFNSLSLKWNVIEQEKFVKIGKENFEDDNLKFYYNTEECLLKNRPNVLVLSSVLQYLEKPYEWIEKFINLNFEYLIIDRTPLTKISKTDIISVQKVNKAIYNASYPCWLFNEDRFFSVFKDKYEVIFEDNSPDRSNFKEMIFKGFVLKLKK